ncbi:MAG: extracellular solute-binding protein [Eubacteriales bacterium]|nr:extracellular solute-binding protein [Eubacteriales bacterium]
MKKKIAVSVMIFSLLAIILPMFSGCSGQRTVQIDSTKTQLYVYNYDGGVGTDWLERVQERFENEYAETKFEPGVMVNGVEKKGVQIVISAEKSVPTATLASSNNEVFFLQTINYNELASQGRLLDISDIMTKKLPGEEKTLADKLLPSQLSAFSALNGNYYVLPHYEIISGLTYDVDLFEEKKFFIKDDGTWTNFEESYNEDPALCRLSAGPDGIKGNYDDGLPANYGQLEKLCIRMSQLGVTPFVWAGQLQHYFNYLFGALWCKYQGAEEMSYNVTHNSGAKTTRVISSFNGTEPVLEEVQIPGANLSMLKRQAGKYYAVEFLSKIFENNWYNPAFTAGTVSHLDAQAAFVFGRLEGAPIGMLIEGNYWYHEASDAIRRSENTYSDEAKNRRLAWMPLPGVPGDTPVTEENGVKDSAYDLVSAFAFINNNISSDENKKALAKLFLQYCYTDESLQDFTMVTGLRRGVQYELKDEQFGQMNYYFQSLYTFLKNADVLYPYSDTEDFVRNQGSYNFTQHSSMFQSNIDGTFQTAFALLKRDVSAKDFFVGMW